MYIKKFSKSSWRCQYIRTFKQGGPSKMSKFTWFGRQLGLGSYWGRWLRIHLVSKFKMAGRCWNICFFRMKIDTWGVSRSPITNLHSKFCNSKGGFNIANQNVNICLIGMKIWNVRFSRFLVMNLQWNF